MQNLLVIEYSYWYCVDKPYYFLLLIGISKQFLGGYKYFNIIRNLVLIAVHDLGYF